jgi:hypothetical protein
MALDAPPNGTASRGHTDFVPASERERTPSRAQSPGRRYVPGCGGDRPVGAATYVECADDPWRRPRFYGTGVPASRERPRRTGEHRERHSRSMVHGRLRRIVRQESKAIIVRRP